MILVYAPEGGEPQEWEVDPTDFRMSEIKELELLSGKSWTDYWPSLGVKSVGDVRPLVYLLCKRDKPDVKYRDIDPRLREVELKFPEDEVEMVRAAIEANDAIVDKEQALAALDAATVVPEGKGSSSPRAARSRRSGTSTKKR
jgi:hypothetical protein